MVTIPSGRSLNSTRSRTANGGMAVGPSTRWCVTARRFLKTALTLLTWTTCTWLDRTEVRFQMIGREQQAWKNWTNFPVTTLEIDVALPSSASASGNNLFKIDLDNASPLIRHMWDGKWAPQTGDDAHVSVMHLDQYMTIGGYRIPMTTSKLRAEQVRL